MEDRIMKNHAFASVDQIMPIVSDGTATVYSVPDMERLVLLTAKNMQEVIDFLNVRPVHTVVMSSFLADNGFESKYNRGRFYGYRGTDGELEGVALIGHTTLIEARSDKALRAFAIKARGSEIPIHVMMSEGRVIEKFWDYFRPKGAEPRLVLTEQLFETSFPFPLQDCEFEIKKATAEYLETVAEAHAEVAFIESGVDPLVRDREGFLDRSLRRIEQGRTFVAFENGEVIFKADIVAESSDVTYLEGVWVSEKMRGQGIGPKCLSKLTAALLEDTNNVCLLSRVEFQGAHRSFVKAGYRATDCCTTIFV